MVPTVLIVDDNAELVALLTSLFEEAGYVVIGANKGRTAADLGKTQEIDIALVDVLLPDMMGYLVAEALRAARPKVQLAFMSGVFKGARHSREAASKFPGARYFEKPFDAKELLDHVRGLAPPPKKLAPTPAKVAPPSAFEVELDIDVDGEEDQDPMELTGIIKVSGGGNLTAELTGANLMASRPMKGPIAGDRPPLSMHSRVSSSEMGSKRQGALTDNLPGLITAFYLAKETGELYCQRGQVKKVVYFEAGQPVFALSNLAADRFGQFLTRVGKIKPEQLQDAAVVAAESKRRVGDVLIERGFLKDAERMYFVGQQIKSIIYSLFGWEDGQYVMTFKEKARAEAIKLDVFPGNLIVRGIKKLYKPERLARLVSPEQRFMPSQQPAYALNEVTLEKWEAELLPLIDGTRTNAELFELVQKPEHQVRAFIAAMRGVQMLDAT